MRVSDFITVKTANIDLKYFISSLDSIGYYIILVSDFLLSKLRINMKVFLTLFTLSACLSIGVCFLRTQSGVRNWSGRFAGSTVKDPATAIIIVDHGSRKAEANEMLIGLASIYKNYANVKIVEPAHMEMAEPSIAVAFKRCVEQGAKHIVCHPFFLAPGRHVQEDIPTLMKEASLQYPDVSYTITAPLGLQNGIIQLIDQAVDESLKK